MFLWPFMNKCVHIQLDECGPVVSLYCSNSHDTSVQFSSLVSPPSLWQHFLWLLCWLCSTTSSRSDWTHTNLWHSGGDPCQQEQLILVSQYSVVYLGVSKVTHCLFKTLLSSFAHSCLSSQESGMGSWRALVWWRSLLMHLSLRSHLTTFLDLSMPSNMGPVWTRATSMNSKDIFLVCFCI